MEIAEKEPEIFDPEILEKEMAKALQRNDIMTAESIAQLVSKARLVEYKSEYKYGI